MRTRNAHSGLLVLTGFLTFVVGPLDAQAPAKAPGRGGTAAPQVEENLAQLMRGILFPNSNVIFFAQSEDPGKVPPAKDPALAVDPLANSYGQWQAVENSALALAEAANLLTIPGRKCSNGLPVPIANADWPKFVQGLREAGRKAYTAAQSKDMDKIVDAADTMTTACSNCHDKYREKPTLAGCCK